MHPAAYDFVAEIIDKYLDLNGSNTVKVLELGSYDVNGSVRPLFPEEGYHGVDLRPGPGVDEVADASTRKKGKASYDVVVCTETLEHSPHPAKIMRHAERSLKPGGLLIATMAAPERPPHNTNGDPLRDTSEHYQGIKPNQVKYWLRQMEILELVHDIAAGDLYVAARRPA